MLTRTLQNALSDVLEQFYESQENRLRILAALHSKDLPVDVSFHHIQVVILISCLFYISSMPPLVLFSPLPPHILRQHHR